MSDMQLLAPVLPLEVLSEIADYLKEGDILRLALVSRPFYGIATRLLYRTIALRGPNTVHKCFETLAFNESAARCVKELYISLSPQGFKMSSVLNRTLRAGFKNMESSLVRLSMTTGALPIMALLKRLHFSNLIELLTLEGLHNDVAHFLQAHPQLEILALGGVVSLPEKQRGTKGPHKAMSIAMPALQAFRGPCEALPILLPNSSVDMVEVVCNCHHLDRREQALVDALCTSRTPIRKLAFIGFSYAPAMFDLVKGLKSLTALAFTLVSRESWAPGGSIFDGLVKILPHLPNLYRLDVVGSSSPSAPAHTHTYAHLVEDYGRLLRLAALRDSLCIVSTHSRMQWGRLKNHGSWVPLLPDVATLRWWFVQTGMLAPLQFEAFSIISSVKLPEEKPGQSVEERTDECFLLLRRATSRIVNEAFGLRPTASDEQEHKLLVPIHGSGTTLVAPYSDIDREHIQGITCEMMWDEFVAAVGYASLFTLTQDESLELLIQTMGQPDAAIPVPALTDTQKELFTFALDVLWCSIYGIPLRVAQHLQIPEDHDEWKELVLCLPIRTFSAQLQRNIGANMAALNNISLD